MLIYAVVGYVVKANWYSYICKAKDKLFNKNISKLSSIILGVEV